MPSKTKKSKSIFASISINFVLLILGVCLIIWADKVTSIISIVLGVLLLITAAYYVIDFIQDKRREDNDGEISKVIAAIFLAIVGGFLIYNNSFIKEFISVIVGAGLAIYGLSALSNASVYKKVDESLYKKALIFGGISTVAGALCILGRFVVPDIMLQILGVMMIIFSFSETGTVTLERDQVKKSKKTDAKTAVEAEVISEKPKK